MRSKKLTKGPFPFQPDRIVAYHLACAGMQGCKVSEKTYTHLEKFDNNGSDATQYTRALLITGNFEYLIALFIHVSRAITITSLIICILPIYLSFRPYE